MSSITVNMENLWCVGIVIIFILSSCRKEAEISRERPRGEKYLEAVLRDGVIPKPELKQPTWPKLKRPLIPKVLTYCINSYEELIEILGNNRVSATAIVLENNVTIPLSEYLLSITYTAVPNRTGSSLFNSQLLLEWRRDASEWWQEHYSDVWSLGCVFPNAVDGPFTNLKKGNQIIEINTSIYWGAIPYQGMHIKYIVLD